MIEDNKRFIFSKSKILGKVTYEDFMNLGKELEKIISSNIEKLETKIRTAESSLEYSAVTSSFFDEDLSYISKNRPKYAIDEFNIDIWKKSLEAGFYFKNLENNTNSLMVVLSSDSETPKSLEFYGQNLSEKLNKEILNKFKRVSLKYPIIF